MGDGVLGEKVIETSNGEQEEQQRNTAQKVIFVLFFVFFDTGQQQSLSLTLHGKEQSTCSTKQLLFCYTEQ